MSDLIDKIYSDLNLDQYQVDSSGKDYWRQQVLDGKLDPNDLQKSISTSASNWIDNNSVNNIKPRGGFSISKIGGIISNEYKRGNLNIGNAIDTSLIGMNTSILGENPIADVLGEGKLTGKSGKSGIATDIIKTESTAIKDIVAEGSRLQDNLASLDPTNSPVDTTFTENLPTLDLSNQSLYNYTSDQGGYGNNAQPYTDQQTRLGAWDGLYGTQEQKIADYINTYTGEDIVTRQLTELNQQYNLADTKLNEMLAQRGLDASGAAAQGYTQLNNSRAQQASGIINNRENIVNDKRLQFLGLGLPKEQVLLGNMSSLGASQIGSNTQLQAANISANTQLQTSNNSLRASKYVSDNSLAASRYSTRLGADNANKDRGSSLFNSALNIVGAIGGGVAKA